MNKYGRHAMEAWKMIVPVEYERLENPMEFFTQLGEEAAIQVERLEREIAGPDTPGESYLQKVGRLNAARSQAEEIVREETLTPHPESSEEPEEEELDPITELLHGLHENRRELNEFHSYLDQNQK